MILRRMITKKRKKLYCVICDKYKTFEKPEISYFLEKTLVISIIYRKWINEEEKLFQEEKLIKILKVFGLIKNI